MRKYGKDADVIARKRFVWEVDGGAWKCDGELVGKTSEDGVGVGGSIEQ